MFIRKSLVPGKIKILKSLDSECKSYTQIKRDTGLSDPTLSEYLKWLWKKDYINRDIDSRKYELCQKGKYLLPISDLVDQLNQVLRRSITAPVETDSRVTEVIRQSPKHLQENYIKIANCILITHRALIQAIPEIAELHGENPLISSKKLSNDTIAIKFNKQN